MSNRKWVLYNTLTGEIVKDLQLSSDSVYLDINNGDEATVTIPAYSLSNADRLSWAAVFKSWAKGIALIDNDKAWNASGSVIFAGPIVKRTFDTETETITVSAFSIYEYLKKIPVPPIWTTITDATAIETFEAGSWAGVYSKLLQRGVDPTGKPASWNFINTFTGLPATTGTGYSTTVKVIDQTSVATVLEPLRDETSDKGNEYRFVPLFTDSTKTYITWTLQVGTDAIPQLNFNNTLTVKLYEDPADTNLWRVKNYAIDDDATLIYNKIVINGSTDTVTANLQTTYDVSTDPEMPGLTERFDAGVDLTSGEIAAQLAARIQGSLITDKSIRLTVDNDSTLDWFNHIGKKIIIEPGIKSAGAKLTARIVGISFSNNDEDNAIEIDIVKIASRYPKLPKQKDADVATGDAGYDITDIPVGGGDYGDSYGGDGGGYDGGGDTYTPPAETPETSNPNMLLKAPAANSYVEPPSLFTDAISNITPEGFTYSHNNGVLGTAPVYTYNAATDTIANIVINIKKHTVDEATNDNPVINTAALGTYTISGSTLTSLMALPATTPFKRYNTTTGAVTTVNAKPTFSGSSQNSSNVYINLWTIKNKLFVLITKKRPYFYYNSSLALQQTVAYLHAQKLISLDINTTTGALTNETVLSTKFGPTSLVSGADCFIAPGYPSNPGQGGFSDGIQNGIFQISDNEILFMKLRRFVNWHISTSSTGAATYRDDSQTSTEALGLVATAINPIKADYTSSTTAPTYVETEITPPMPEGVDSETITVFDGTGLVSGVVRNYRFYEYSVNDVPATPTGALDTYYEYDPYEKVLYAVVIGTISPTLYTHPDTVEAEIFKKVFRLKFGAEAAFSPIATDNYNDASYIAAIDAEGNKLLDTVNYVDTTLRSYIPITLDGRTYIAPQTADMTNFSTSNTMYIKDTGWEFERTNIQTNNVQRYSMAGGDLAFASRTPQQFYFKTSTNKVLILSNSETFSTVPSPYKSAAKMADKKVILDTSGKLWVWGDIGAGTALQPTEQTIPIKSSSTLTFTKIVSNSQQVLALDTAGHLWAWGSNANYITAVGTTTGTTNAMVQIGTATYKDIALGELSAAAIDTNGYLFTWGSNTGGATAAGTTSGHTLTPTQRGTAKWLSVDVCIALMAIDETSKLWYAGIITGQTTTNTLTALGTKTWKTISVGDAHYLAIDTDDKLFALGSNTNGRTGLGTSTGTTTTFTQIGTVLTYKSAVASKAQGTFGGSLAITTGGELYEWGYGTVIGKGDTSSTLTPSKVGTSNNWSEVYRGFDAKKTDNTLWRPRVEGTEIWTGTWTTTWRQIFGGETA